MILYGIFHIDFIDFGEIRKQENLKQCHFTQPLTLNKTKANNQTVPIPKQPFFLLLAPVILYGIFHIDFIDFGEKQKNKKTQIVPFHTAIKLE